MPVITVRQIVQAFAILALCVAAGCETGAPTDPARLAPRPQAARDLDPTLIAPATLSATISAGGTSWAAKDVLIGTFPNAIVYDVTLTETLTGTPIYPLVTGVTHGVGGAGCSSGNAGILDTQHDGDGNPYLYTTFASCSDSLSVTGRAVAWGDTYLHLNGIASDWCGDSPCISWSASVTANLVRADGNILIGLANHPGVAATDTAFPGPGRLAFYSTSPNNEFTALTPKDDWHFVPDDGSPEPPVCDVYYDPSVCWTTVKQSGTFHMSGYVNGEFKAALNTVHVTVPQAASVRIVAAKGPNANGSFTLAPGEARISLVAEATPVSLAGAVRWSAGDFTGDRVVTATPSSIDPGASSGFDVPAAQSSSRWTVKRAHPGAAMDQKALAVQVQASITDAQGGSHVAGPAVVRQDTIDTIREEYIDFHVPQGAPSRSEFAIGSLKNDGDYLKFVVVNRRFDAKFDSLMKSLDPEPRVNSGYRNPVHNMFHVPAGKGSGTVSSSWHQYGCAADLQTSPPVDRNSGPDIRSQARKDWQRIADAANHLGFGVEPRDPDPRKPGESYSGVGHVHVQLKCYR